MNLSIIIPVLNEEKNISKLLPYLKSLELDSCETIVVDGGSSDNSAQSAKFHGAKVLASNKGSRAIQMNLGAQHAKGKILYFLHSDVIPPRRFYNEINNAISDGIDLGCFRMKFDKSNLLLKVNEYFTRFDKLWCRGGDQSLFIKSSAFKSLNGFNENFTIMEDYEILIRARDRFRFTILPSSVRVSARKYNHNSYWKVMLANYKAFQMFRNGADSNHIKITYQQTLSNVNKSL